MSPGLFSTNSFRASYRYVPFGHMSNFHLWALPQCARYRVHRLNHNGKAVLVIGATSGIGRAVSARFADGGYHVFVHARDKKRGSELVEDLRTQGASSQLLLADLRDAAAPTVIIEQIRQSGQQLHCLVNNAGGVLGERSFQRGDVNEMAESYQVNVFAAYALSVLAAELMDAGSIVNISSINAHDPLMGARCPVYSSAKAALSHLTQLLAVKLAPQVRVNAVSPGRTKTDVWGRMEPERERELVQDALIQRWVDADEIADAVWFLAHNMACTGADLIADGGIGLTTFRANT